MSPPWSRPEPFGAWVRLDDATLVAVDGPLASRLGVDHGRPLGAATRPLELHIAVTSRCPAPCEGCYLDARPDGVEPPREEIEGRFDALAQAGVFTVAFGGGEPTLRDDLGELADAARARGLTPVVTTSGLGLGARKIERLTRFAQVNVSYDGAGPAYEAVRGFDGADEAESAIARLAQAGVRVGVNVVLTRATFEHVPETLRRAFALGAREAQLLRYKPAGRAVRLDYLARRLTREQVGRLGVLLRSLAGELPEMRLRIDCALVPFLVDDAELANADALARWGVLGCEAGASLAATRVDGRVLPCSFATPSAIDASEIGAGGWERDATLDAFRGFPTRAPEPCASCTLRSVCRGGCKIVTTHLEGAIGPDPECPRVDATRRSRDEASASAPR